MDYEFSDFLNLYNYDELSINVTLVLPLALAELVEQGIFPNIEPKRYGLTSGRKNIPQQSVSYHMTQLPQVDSETVVDEQEMEHQVSQLETLRVGDALHTKQLAQALSFYKTVLPMLKIPFSMTLEASGSTASIFALPETTERPYQVTERHFFRNGLYDCEQTEHEQALRNDILEHTKKLVSHSNDPAHLAQTIDTLKSLHAALDQQTQRQWSNESLTSFQAPEPTGLQLQLVHRALKSESLMSVLLQNADSKTFELIVSEYTQWLHGNRPTLEIMQSSVLATLTSGTLFDDNPSYFRMNGAVRSYLNERKISLIQLLEQQHRTMLTLPLQDSFWSRLEITPPPKNQPQDSIYARANAIGLFWRRLHAEMLLPMPSVVLNVNKNHPTTCSLEDWAAALGSLHQKLPKTHQHVLEQQTRDLIEALSNKPLYDQLLKTFPAFSAGFLKMLNQALPETKDPFPTRARVFLEKALLSESPSARSARSTKTHAKRL